MECLWVGRRLSVWWLILSRQAIATTFNLPQASGPAPVVTGLEDEQEYDDWSDDSSSSFECDALSDVVYLKDCDFQQPDDDHKDME